nr:heme uptake protein IsdC [Paenibacillus thalictri]
MLMFLFALFALSSAQAATLSDGTYTVGYTIKQAENDSASMANDYFEKPAKLFVKDGKQELQIQMNHSKWITQFKVPDNGGFSDAAVVSSDSTADTRIVRFKLNDDLSKPLLSKIHVTVESIDYDHDYTIRFAFDEKSLKKAEEKAAPAASETKPAAGAAASGASKPEASAVKAQEAPAQKTQVSSATAGGAQASASAGKSQAAALNPQTGDPSSAALWIIVLAASVLCLGYITKTRKSGM